MRIGFVSALDASDPKSWSGTNYFSAQALSEYAGTVVNIGPIQPSSLWFKRAESRIRNTMHFGRILPKQSFRVARDNARLIERKIKSAKPDILCAPAGSALIGFLNSELPILYFSDATARLMFNYNPEFAKLTDEARKQADELEQKAITRADILLYPTEWAAQSAIDHYNADPDKVHVAPFGANLSKVPEREKALAPRIGSKLRLIFVGVNWKGKGGAIAVEALRELIAKGFDAELTIVGCVPPADVARDRITVIPFLDKNDPAQAKKLSDLYLESDFLILPTRNECFGIVFCEAAAHGVISIATATGGVPDVVKHGTTGFVLAPECGGREYAERISEVMSDKDHLSTLRRNARDDYENRLNWEAWASRVKLLAGLTLPKYRQHTG